MIYLPAFSVHPCGSISSWGNPYQVRYRSVLKKDLTQTDFELMVRVLNMLRVTLLSRKRETARESQYFCGARAAGRNCKESLLQLIAKENERRVSKETLRGLEETLNFELCFFISINTREPEPEARSWLTALLIFTFVLRLLVMVR